jgi:hypothetical protein
MYFLLWEMVDEVFNSTSAVKCKEFIESIVVTLVLALLPCISPYGSDISFGWSGQAG